MDDRGETLKISKFSLDDKGAIMNGTWGVKERALNTPFWHAIAQYAALWDTILIPV